MTITSTALIWGKKNGQSTLKKKGKKEALKSHIRGGGTK